MLPPTRAHVKGTDTNADAFLLTSAVRGSHFPRMVAPSTLVMLRLLSFSRPTGGRNSAFIPNYTGAHQSVKVMGTGLFTRDQ
jgi:hypothetical protein